MRFSEGWLREWVNPDLSTGALGEILTLGGLELEGIFPAAPDFQNVVVAWVREVRPHPQAERLLVCTVDDGHTPVKVVCGAPDVAEGLHVPFARAGAVLPGGQVIEIGTVRGVTSEGMLCSAQELGLSESAMGLMHLPADAPLGTSLRDYLALDDTILEVNLTPNRADCLSILGLAREVAALTSAPLRAPVFTPVIPTHLDTLPVKLMVAADCPHYVGRVITGVDPAAATPVWMQERLRRSGLRSISLAVDVTNYVMLELGQPMHAFDLACIDGGLIVRRAKPGEHLALLDGRTVELDQDTLVIADHAHALAIAGIMGGSESATTRASSNLFLESAFFTPQAIAGRARRYGLHTESSHRFERGVDPQLQVSAMERATQLLIEFGGARPGPLVNVAAPDQLPTQPVIELDPAQVSRLLGVAMDTQDINRRLESLGACVRLQNTRLMVKPPSFRFDLSLEADLIEEVARLHGYARIPAQMPVVSMSLRPVSEAAMTPVRLRGAFIDQGYHEIVTLSFIDAQTQRLFTPQQAPRMLANPLSEALSVMRTSLLPGLVKVALHNLRRQHTSVRLFELGHIFSGQDEALTQTLYVSGVATGQASPEQWGRPNRMLDFFDLKGDLEQVLDGAGRLSLMRFQPGEHPALHPGQSAMISDGERQVGWAGQLHPRIQRELDLSSPVFVFELAAEPLTAPRVPILQALSRFPMVRRDVALVVDEGVSAAQVLDNIKAAKMTHLREAFIFDVFRGQTLAPGRKSLALGLIFQAFSRTLEDHEVDPMVERVVARLRESLNAELRG